MRDRSRIIVSMNRLPLEMRVQVLSALVEGVSIRATARMTGVSKTTILKLLADVGWACDAFHDRVMRNLHCGRIECDEIWAFCGKKQAQVPKEMRGELGVGDVWTYVALDADTKLVPSWILGKRTPFYTHAFMYDLASRLKSRPQITTDGMPFYVAAVDEAFQGDVDFAQLIKLYEHAGEAGRYSPPACIGTRKMFCNGDPDPAYISTSYVERQNLTIRMQMRRFTRLTNGFSKKYENLGHALALHFMHYNFCRKHMTLKTTPAVAAGLTDHAWTLHEVARMADDLNAQRAA
jgi:IS1 family transposase